MYLNKVFLYGNLTRDPELRALPSGQQVASFSIATNRTFKDKNGQKQEAVEFHNVVAFGRLADTIGQYMKKGRPIFIEGRLQTRSWDDKQGQKRKTTEIIAEQIQFGPRSAGGGMVRNAAPAGGEGTDISRVDEIPVISVDEEIKSGNPLDSRQALGEILNDALQTITDEIRQEAPNPSETPADTGVIRSELLILMAALKNYELPDDAKLTALLSQLAARIPAQRICELERHLHGFDFEAATLALQQIVAELSA